MKKIVHHKINELFATGNCCRLVEFLLLKPPLGGALQDLMAVETDQLHERLGHEEYRLDMPEESRSRDNAHEIDEDDGGKACPGTCD